jgi:hypothetical protein
MSTTTPWISSAQEELLELEQRHSAGGLDPDDLYRLAVLGARLGQARAAGWEADLPGQLDALLRQATTTAVRPGSDRLLARLDEVLTSDEDPFGELMDALLDVDNAVTFDEAFGRAEAARELAHGAEARVSLFAARVGPLGELAEHRLETLPAQASIRGLWETVAHAAAQAVIEAMPPVTPAPASLPRQRLLKRLVKERIEEDVSSAPELAPLYAVAAAEARETVAETSTHGAVDVFTSGKEIRVLVDLPPGKRLAGEVEFRVSAGERSSTSRARLVSSSQRAVIARLGTIDELREWLRREGFSMPLQGVQLAVSLTLEDVPNDDR